MSTQDNSPNDAELILTPLISCAVDTERHVAAGGWDQPPRLFAIARNADIASREPALAAQLADVDPDAYSTIEQEGLPAEVSVEETLGRLAWPPQVDGVALALEQIVVPPEAEQDLPQDPEKATRALAAHPDREDVRLLVAVLRDGDAVCLLRQRSQDSDDRVAISQDLAPGLIQALQATFD
ncbi:PPA1309 family protein [Dermacoccaceae bacterium W4C1]